MPPLLNFSQGWKQRRSRALFQEGECVDALNLTPVELGAVTTRLGMRLDVTLDHPDAHSLGSMYTPAGTLVTYQGAETKLYRDAAGLVVGLSGALISYTGEVIIVLIGQA